MNFLFCLHKCIATHAYTPPLAHRILSLFPKCSGIFGQRKQHFANWKPLSDLVSVSSRPATQLFRTEKERLHDSAAMPSLALSIAPTRFAGEGDLSLYV